MAKYYFLLQQASTVVVIFGAKVGTFYFSVQTGDGNRSYVVLGDRVC